MGAAARRSVPAASVIIPAHNEAATVGRCLDRLLEHASPGEFQVIVAANGCTDGTAAIARSKARQLGQHVTVMDLPAANKVDAIRAAEELAPVFPRIVLDADVVCPAATVRALVSAIEGGAPLAVPSRRLVLESATSATRRYYRAWERLPWVRDQLAGRGAYAMSSELRQTYGDMPNLIADDRFVTTRVPRSRAAVVAEAVHIAPPVRLPDVVRVRRRVYRGNHAGPVPSHDQTIVRRVAHMVALFGVPRRWPDLAVFAAVTAAAKAPWPFGGTGWARDTARGAAR